MTQPRREEGWQGWTLYGCRICACLSGTSELRLPPKSKSNQALSCIWEYCKRFSVHLWVLRRACPVCMGCDIHVTEQAHAVHRSYVILSLPYAVYLKNITHLSWSKQPILHMCTVKRHPSQISALCNATPACLLGMFALGDKDAQ